MIDAGHPYLGFYSSPGQTEPAYDPPHNGPCIACNIPLNIPVKTVSLMPEDADGRSYFYRAHKSCYETNPKAADAIAMEMIECKSH